jgi:hypothetical protein
MRKHRLIIFLVVFIFPNLITLSEENNLSPLVNVSKEDSLYLASHVIPEENFLEQKVKERKFIGNLERLKNIEINKIGIPFGALYKEYMFIIDYKTLRIHRLSLKDTGDYIIFGRGRGEKPGQLINPIDIAFDDDKMFICDIGKSCFRNGTCKPVKEHAVELYSLAGSFIRSIEVESRPWRMILNTKKDEILIYNDRDKIRKFCRYDYNGNLINKFGSPLIAKYIYSPYYHGTILCQLSNSSFLQIPTNLGIMGFYKNDSLLFVKKTLDGLQDPKVIRKGNREYPDKNRIVPAARAAANTDKVLLLRGEKSNGKKVGSLYDVYDKNTLDYICTFDIPAKTYHIILKNDTLITYNNSSISLWQLPSEL